jgi:hypothetical protein
MSKEQNSWMLKAIDQAILGSSPFGAAIVNDKKDYLVAYNTTK